MQKEMKTLIENKTWEVVTILQELHLVSLKWVFTIKYKLDGCIERYKTHLVAKGFSQRYMIDYLETFTPIAKMNTIKDYIISSNIKRLKDVST